MAPGPSLAGVRLLIAEHAVGLPVLRALSLVSMLSPLPRRSHWVPPLLASPAVSAFPDMAVGSARASTFSRLVRRSLALRPAHSRCHRISWHALPKASTVSLPPQLLRLLPAGAVAGWGFHPLEKRRLFTAHANTGNSVGRIACSEAADRKAPARVGPRIA